MSWSLRKFIRETRGVAAAEFAMVLPLLVVMLFFFWEYGRFVEGTHAVNKAARDGVRIAGRQPWPEFGCASTGPPTFDRDAIKAYVVASLGAWQATPANVSVTFTCGNSFTGIYKDLIGGAPVVTVTVSVPYLTLFGGTGGALGLNLKGSAQTAVMGI